MENGVKDLKSIAVGNTVYSKSMGEILLLLSVLFCSAVLCSVGTRHYF